MMYITGANGFIGQHLTKELSSRMISWRELARIRDNTGWIEEKDHTGQLCIHLAAQNNLKSCNDSPEQVVLDAQQLAKSLVNMNFSHIIFASSAVVYGYKSNNLHLETDPTINEHPYAKAKLAAEKIILDAGHSVFRLANVYGSSDMEQDNVFSDIIKQLPNIKDDITVHDDSCIRDFIDVDDVVDCFIQFSRDPLPGVYNLGTGIGTSIQQLVQLFLEHVGTPDRKIKSMKQNSPTSSLIIESSKLMIDYNWTAKIKLPVGTKNILGAQ